MIGPKWSPYGGSVRRITCSFSLLHVIDLVTVLCWIRLPVRGQPSLKAEVETLRPLAEHIYNRFYETLSAIEVEYAGFLLGGFVVCMFISTGVWALSQRSCRRRSRLAEH